MTPYSTELPTAGTVTAGMGDRRPTHGSDTARAAVNAAYLEPRGDRTRIRRRPRINRDDLCQFGWPLGTAKAPRAVPLWVPADRTTAILGPQGSGKSLDLLLPALMQHPGAGLLTVTKPEDLYLVLQARRRLPGRSSKPRPVVVLDPYGVTAGLPELLFDPIAGCTNPITAQRRAAAFGAGTVQGSSQGDDAARYYAAEVTKVLQCYLHAAALAGRTLDDVLAWAAAPRTTRVPEDILATHPDATEHWSGLLHSTLHGDPKTAGNTISTLQQAVSLFLQPDYRARCVPSPGRPATNIAHVIRAGGTIVLLGREDAYLSASPLMTAVAEHVLDTALELAHASPHRGRLCPSLMAALDELPSVAPIPTLAQRLANDRALGITFVYATQTWHQMVRQYGEGQARDLFNLSNVMIVFGRGKELQYYEDISRLLGDRYVERWSTTRSSSGVSRTRSTERVPVIAAPDLRRIPERQALVVVDDAPPIMANLHRCIDGKPGRELLREQAEVRAHVLASLDAAARTAALQASPRITGPATTPALPPGHRPATDPAGHDPASRPATPPSADIDPRPSAGRSTAPPAAREPEQPALSELWETL